jgi:hypothetical protein
MNRLAQLRLLNRDDLGFPYVHVKNLVLLRYGELKRFISNGENLAKFGNLSVLQET